MQTGDIYKIHNNNNKKVYKRKQIWYASKKKEKIYQDRKKITPLGNLNQRSLFCHFIELYVNFYRLYVGGCTKVPYESYQYQEIVTKSTNDIEGRKCTRTTSKRWALIKDSTTKTRKSVVIKYMRALALAIWIEYIPTVLPTKVIFPVKQGNSFYYHTIYPFLLGEI